MRRVSWWWIVCVVCWITQGCEGTEPVQEDTGPLEPEGCRITSECDVGEICNENNRCTKAPSCEGEACSDCTQDSDCQPEERCEPQRQQCVPDRPLPQCTQDQECPLGQLCVDNECKTDTDADRDRDGVPDRVDSCPEIENTSQTDTDNDGLGDACDSDIDNDDIPNENDNCPSIPNPDQSDVDEDNLGDVCEADTDNDGVPDDDDNCMDTSNPDQANLDQDDLGDVCDPDDDNDGVPDETDNCPNTPNPDQADIDGDNIGNACEGDADTDGVPNDDDNCPDTPNPGQANLDEDDLGDACDPDDDNDIVPDETDNCPHTPNPEQADIDSDGIGDACEGDLDTDGVPDDDDNCPDTPNPAQSNLDEDGLGDACDPDDDNDDVPDETDNCPNNPNPDQADIDSDNIGDACEGDADTDGVPDDDDNCRDISNPDQANLDQDDLGDACDDDVDGDGVFNTLDNCPTIPNPNQNDIDNDGLGNLCDNDIDGDNIEDNQSDALPCSGGNTQGCNDNCPLETNPNQEDNDGDQIGDVCDDDDDSDTVIDTEDNCPLFPNADQSDMDGDSLGDPCDDDIDGDGIPNDGDGSGQTTDAPCTGGNTQLCDDNCPEIPNEEQSDINADGTGDLCDPNINALCGDCGVNRLEGDTLFCNDPCEPIPRCTPGILRCGQDEDTNHETIEQCDETGFDWIVTSSCDAQEACQRNENNQLQCIPLCTPNSQRCLDGFTIEVCAENGRGWITQGICADQFSCQPVGNSFDCQSCEERCAHLQNSQVSCGEDARGECTFEQCLPNFRECNGFANDGCEPTNDCGGCNELDNNIGDSCGNCDSTWVCDGPMAESLICESSQQIECGIACFDPETDPDHCGECDNSCQRPGLSPMCHGGECFFEQCAPGFVDIDNNLQNGCEYSCTPTNNGIEICDNLDNNCDGFVDENVDKNSDPQHCGGCGVVCDEVLFGRNASTACVAGECVREICNDFYFDTDTNHNNGCEEDVRQTTNPSATYLYVDANAPGPTEDGSPEFPFAKLSTALQSGPNRGDIIEMAPGRYNETNTISIDTEYIVIRRNPALADAGQVILNILPDNPDGALIVNAQSVRLENLVLHVNGSSTGINVLEHGDGPVELVHVEISGVGEANYNNTFCNNQNDCNCYGVFLQNNHSRVLYTTVRDVTSTQCTLHGIEQTGRNIAGEIIASEVRDIQSPWIVGIHSIGGHILGARIENLHSTNNEMGRITGIVANTGTARHSQVINLSGSFRTVCMRADTAAFQNILCANIGSLQDTTGIEVAGNFGEFEHTFLSHLTLYNLYTNNAETGEAVGIHAVTPFEFTLQSSIVERLVPRGIIVRTGDPGGHLTIHNSNLNAGITCEQANIMCDSKQCTDGNTLCGNVTFGAGNLSTPSLFLDPDALDFRLQLTSPLLDAGGVNSPCTQEQNLSSPTPCRADMGHLGTTHQGRSALAPF